MNIFKPTVHIDNHNLIQTLLCIGNSLSSFSLLENQMIWFLLKFDLKILFFIKLKFLNCNLVFEFKY